MSCGRLGRATRRSVSPVGWREQDEQEYRNGARLLRRFLEHRGRTLAIPPIGMQGRLSDEQRRGARLGVAAVTRALGGDLGGYRLAGYGRAMVISAANCRPVADKPRLIRQGSHLRPAQLRLSIRSGPATGVMAVRRKLAERSGYPGVRQQQADDGFCAVLNNGACPRVIGTEGKAAKPRLRTARSAERVCKTGEGDQGCSDRAPPAASSGPQKLIGRGNPISSLALVRSGIPDSAVGRSSGFLDQSSRTFLYATENKVKIRAHRMAHHLQRGIAQWTGVEGRTPHEV